MNNSRQSKYYIFVIIITKIFLSVYMVLGITIWYSM